MDKWEELRETIKELHEGNVDKPDVETVTRFLLNLMNVLDSKAEEQPLQGCHYYAVNNKKPCCVHDCDRCIYGTFNFS